MRALVAASLRLRGLVLVGALALLAGGTVAALRAPIDAFPEFAPPLVEIQTEAPGLAATEVEQLVTVPLENALNGLPLLETMRSKSVSGLSSIVLIFGERTKILEARQLVQERLAAVAVRLPQVARPPVLLQPLSATSRIMKVGLTSKTRSQMEMTDVVRWTVRPRLMALPGVANVAIWGERDRQLQILVDPERLRANAVRLDDVLRVAREGVTPSAGGFVDTPNQRLAVTHAASVRVAGDLAALPIRTPGGGLLRLGDVAEVREGFPSPIGDAVVNGQPGLLLIVEKQPAANTLEVTRRVEQTLAALGGVLSGIDVDARVFRPATFIERAIRNLADALVIGCILVVVILALFLYDWRTALISVLAIPLSLVVAVLVLSWVGTTLNTMVLAGLAIALGEVVDDAIIDVENVLRRLRENRALDAPRAAIAVVLDASLEVRSAVIYATLIVLAVFLPVFLLDGISGALFRPLGTAYALAVSASLVVALVVTPALALMLLPGAAHRQRRAPFAERLARVHRRWLTPLVDRPRAALAILCSLFVLTVAVVPLLGESFLPRFRENDFLMHWVAKPGSSLEALRRTTVAVSKELLVIPGVRSFGAHLGRAEVADEVVGTNFAELWVSVDPEAPYDQTVDAIHRTIAGYAGIRRDVQTYLEERVKEVVAGRRAPS